MAKRRAPRPGWEAIADGDAQSIIQECRRCQEEEAPDLPPRVRFRMLAIARALEAHDSHQGFDLTAVFEQIRQIARGGAGIPADVADAARHAKLLINPVSFFNTYISGKQGDVKSRRFNYYVRASSRRLGLPYEAVIACVRQGNNISYRLRRARTETPPCDPKDKDPAASISELTGLLGEAATIMAIRGWGDRDVGSAYRIARTVDEGLLAPDPRMVAPLRFEVAIGLWSHYLVRADFSRAQAEVARLRHLASREGDHSMRVVALRAAGTTDFWLGRFADAERHLGQCLDELGDGSAYRPYSTDLGAPPLSLVSSDLADTLWVLGRHGAAADMIAAARQQAVRSAHPFHDCYSLAFACWIGLKHGDHTLAAQDAARLRELADRYGLLALRALGQSLVGLTAAIQADDPRNGFDDLFEGLGEWRATGSELLVCFFYAETARIWLRLGDPRHAEVELSKAIRVAEKTGEGYYAAEIRRLQGEIQWLGNGDFESAETILREALKIATAQQSASFGLRSATSLVTMTRKRTDLTSAARGHRLATYEKTLAESCDLFQGHTESADLRFARTLLARA